MNVAEEDVGAILRSCTHETSAFDNIGLTVDAVERTRYRSSLYLKHVGVHTHRIQGDMATDLFVGFGGDTAALGTS